ncbi:MAG: PAS domain S-box protein [Deltaproteobacteria bacterium]|nr:MAG: PAS domain S-box protein [Deltaproteobacteria bacterium]
MSPFKPKYNLAIVGAGRQGMSILAALVPPRKEDESIRVVGVADLNPEAPGILYAYRHNLFVTVNFTDLLQLPEVNIIVNATGSPEVSRRLNEQRPENLIVLSVDRPYSWEKFWDLISMELSSQEFAPLRLGIVGGGKAAHEVLQLITEDPRHKRRIEILGVADPDLEALGMILAQSLNIPTFRDYTHLLAEKPDLILELTGNSQVREQIIQRKDPYTQVIDHIKARLFWDLLRYEEDWVRSKIESEIKLAGQRNRFQRIFNHLPDPVLVLKPDYIVEEANLPSLERFQKKFEEVVGRPCYEVFHGFKEPCDRLGMTCPLPEVMENYQIVKVTQRFDNADGTERFDEITMAPLCPPEGTRKRVIEVIRDVTARKQLEEALAESEERVRKDKAFLETIVNGIQDHMMVIGLDYRIIEVNRALLQMVGRKREEVVGKFCYEVTHHLKHPCADPEHPCPLKDAVATGKASSVTHVHFDKQGRERFYQVVCHPIYDENGRIHQVVDLARDVTQEIMARTQMLHDDKMTSLGKLSASVVHEINNPLTGILNFVKLMQTMLDDGDPGQDELGDIRNYLSMVYDETARVSKTLSNLLAFSRKSKPNFQPVNLNAEIEETISLIGHQMRLQNITVKRHLDADLHQVLADRGQIKQILVNLVLNAQEAMSQGGTLTLETKNIRRDVLIKISDTGKGIPRESLSQIFEPFFTTKKTCSGAGLGLSVVYGIIRDHKGIIKVDSVLEKGTTFTIRLPALKAGEEHGAA